MKNKLVLAILAATLSTTALAAERFTGASVGLDVETSKYSKQEALKAKNTGAAVAKAAYSVDYGNNFVGQIEASANLNSSKAYQEANSDFAAIKVKQKNKFTVGYAQGYRVTSDLMPYVKAQYISSKMGVGATEVSEAYSERLNGVGVGLGAKYAVSDNVELGAEYVRSRLKKGDTKLNGNTVSAGVSYRFK